MQTLCALRYFFFALSAFKIPLYYSFRQKLCVKIFALFAVKIDTQMSF